MTGADVRSLFALLLVSSSLTPPAAALSRVAVVTHRRWRSGETCLDAFASQSLRRLRLATRRLQAPSRCLVLMRRKPSTEPRVPPSAPPTVPPPRTETSGEQR